MASSAVSHQSHSGQLLHAPAGSMMARVERLDLVVGYLEEMRHHGSARSSTSPSTPTTFSSSSPPTTPRSAGRCRPAEELLRETRAKGSLVERIAFLENRVLRMEEERLETTGTSVEMTTPERTGRLSRSMNDGGSSGSGRKKKGLKSLVKSCVRAGAKLKTKD